jgi:hypothetical protein
LNEHGWPFCAVPATQASFVQNQPSGHGVLKVLHGWPVGPAVQDPCDKLPRTQ